MTWGPSRVLDNFLVYRELEKRDNRQQDRHSNGNTERSLIGSLVDEYKEGGLVKKTMSVTVNGVFHHLVAYYNINEAVNGELKEPMTDARLRDVQPRHELVHKQNFRVPLDDTDGFVVESRGDASQKEVDYGNMFDFNYLTQPAFAAFVDFFRRVDNN